MKTGDPVAKKPYFVWGCKVHKKEKGRTDIGALPKKVGGGMPLLTLNMVSTW